MLQKIIILGTGGTIAGWASDPAQPQRYQSAQLGIEALLASSDVNLQDVEFEQLAQIDSKDISDDFWRKLLSRALHHLQRPDVQGLVITHGTDTLEETAFFLSALLPCDKPVALTAAMRAANHPQADGPENVRNAISAVAQTRFKGVAVVMAGRWWAGSQVQKLKAYAPEAVGVFEPWAWGDLLESMPPVILSPPESVTPWPGPETVLAHLQWPRVEVLLSHAGAQAWLLKALLKDTDPPLSGLVLAATGAGTWHQSWDGVIVELLARGTSIWVSTRCALDRLAPRHEQGIEWVPYTPVQARVGLMLTLIGSGLQKPVP